MSRFKPHLSILPLAQRDLWPQLGAASSLGFVLYGGTAIALRLGHRSSIDFDFFTERPLDKIALREVFAFLGKAQLLQDRPDTLTVNVFPETSPAYPVKISFFGGIDFGRYSDPDVTDDGTLQVAALDDLMATKLKVMLQRVEARDYEDVAAMLKAGQRLDRGLAIARAMFGRDFQPSESLKALTWFEGGDLRRIPEETRKLLIEAAAAVRRLPSITKTAQALALPPP